MVERVLQDCNRYGCKGASIGQRHRQDCVAEKPQNHIEKTETNKKVQQTKVNTAYPTPKRDLGQTRPDPTVERKGVREGRGKMPLSLALRYVLIAFSWNV